jgi:hypothetical protein
MCDWDEREYAEYLLWVEAETAKVRLRRHVPSTPPEVSDVILESEQLLATEV